MAKNQREITRAATTSSTRSRSAARLPGDDRPDGRGSVGGRRLNGDDVELHGGEGQHLHL
jgi:hypothetical protein